MSSMRKMLFQDVAEAEISPLLVKKDGEGVVAVDGLVIPACFVDDADAGFFHRHVQSGIVFRGCASPLMLEAAHADLVQSST